MTGWSLEYIDRLSLTRAWAFLSNWQKHPPLHRLFAMFVGYGKDNAEAAGTASPKKSFEITPNMLQAFGGPSRQVCRQSSLHPRIKKSVEEFQATEAYKNWRSKLDARLKDGS